MNDIVRICPLCGKHNPPDETFCACGTLLADVDFTHLGDEHLETSQVIQAVSEDHASVICPYPDCAQPNPQDSLRCVYCNREIEQVGASDEQHLPPSLRARFRVLESLPTEGGQADLVLVETAQQEKRVVKLYRKGIKPDWNVLERLPENEYLVRFFDHGMAENIAFEVMEYCTEGSLRKLLKSWPQADETLRNLIAQMSEVLTALHRQQILHRDLKPENILVRTVNPLKIALTDFGASSLKMATQYFTGGARTVNYAAPEVLTGVLDEKSDWWSLGMILLEVITGRHPYADLSEQVVLHQLATQSVEVKDVFDDTLRMLCRGLLMRNPKKRWGSNEVKRWLAGDESLIMPEDGNEGTAVRPYTLRRAQCLTRIDLALAMARYWEDAKKDLMRGTVMNWVEQDLRDFNLARDINDIMIRRDLSDDARLLRVIVSALPGIPPIWKGRVITQESLVRSALPSKAECVAEAVNDDRMARSWLLSIYREGVLNVLGESGNADMERISRQWVQGVDSYRRLWDRAKALEEDWRRKPMGNTNEAVDIDYLMYLAPIRMNVPPLDMILPDLVLALYVPAFSASNSKTIMSACARMGESCSWYSRLIEETTEKNDIFWVVLQRLLPFAMEDAKKEHKHRQQVELNSEKDVTNVLSRIRQGCKRLLRFDDMKNIDGSDVEQLHKAVTEWIELGIWVKSIDYGNATIRNITAKLDAVTVRVNHLQDFLDEYQNLLDINDIWFKPARLMIAAAIIATMFAYSVTFALILAFLAGVGIHWRLKLAKTGQIECLRRVSRAIESVKQFNSCLSAQPQEVQK